MSHQFKLSKVTNCLLWRTVRASSGTCGSATAGHQVMMVMVMVTMMMMMVRVMTIVMMVIMMGVSLNIMTIKTVRDVIAR